MEMILSLLKQQHKKSETMLAESGCKLNHVCLNDEIKAKPEIKLYILITWEVSLRLSSTGLFRF